MPKQKVPFNALEEYLPNGAMAIVIGYLNQYKIQLTITKDRKSILGDYRPPSAGFSHRISINGSLNKYSFLVTFIHELAHLLTHLQYQRRVEPHGKEWQQQYAILLDEFVGLQLFPNDLVIAIRKSQTNPAASSCAEVHLTKALSAYDANPHNLVFVEQVPIGKQFVTKDGRLFEKGEKRRTRHFGKEVNTNKVYLFSSVYKVKIIE